MIVKTLKDIMLFVIQSTIITIVFKKTFKNVNNLQMLFT